MLTGRVSLTGDARLAGLRRRIVNQRGVQLVAGRAGRNTTVKHLRDYNRAHPNRLGGRRTNFYAKAADATSFHLVGDDTVEITSNAIGLALRFHGTDGLPGGVLKPVKVQFLTIPAIAEAHGYRAREFSDLEFGFALDPELGKMRPALVRRSDSLVSLRRRAKKGAGRRVDLPLQGPGTEDASGEPVFWLVRQVRMEGDPTVLPTEDKLADDVWAAVEDYLDLIDERRAA